MFTKLPYEDYFPTDRNEIHFQRYKKLMLKCINRGHLEKDKKNHPGEIEYHHILPSSFWKDSFNNKNKNQIFIDGTLPFNIIGLTVREHFIAHLMLWKAFPEAFNKAMLYAFWEFFNTRKEVSLTSRQYQNLKIEFSKTMSEKMKGKNNPFYNKNHSKETLEILKLRKKNVIWINNGIKEHILEESIALELLSSKGWIRGRLFEFSETTRKQISESLAGFKWVTNDIEEFEIHSEELEVYLDNGYRNGMLKRIWIHKDGKKKRVLEKELDFYKKEGWIEEYLSSMTKEQALQISKTLSGSKWFNNGEEQRYVNRKEVQDYLNSSEWKEGQLPKEKDLMCWVYCKNEEKKIYKSDLESFLLKGWKKGRVYKGSKLQKENTLKAIKGTKWYNNGEKQIRVFPEDIAEYEKKGWKKGQLPSVLRSEQKSEKCGRRTRNKIWINKDCKNKRIFRSEFEDYLNSGWKKGMFYKTN